LFPTKVWIVSMATWVFGALLLIFFFWVFAFAPGTLPEFRLRILAVFSALLAGLFGYFLIGDLGVNIEAAKGGDTGEVKTEIKVTGGFALFVIVLYWWFSPFTPVKASRAIEDGKEAAKGVGQQTTKIDDRPRPSRILAIQV
jgi:hypothetical protein